MRQVYTGVCNTKIFFTVGRWYKKKYSVVSHPVFLWSIKFKMTTQNFGPIKRK